MDRQPKDNSHKMQDSKASQPLVSAQERVQLLENIMDSVPSMIGYWDHNLINRYSNKAYQAYFGKTREEIEGRSIRNLLGEDLYHKNVTYMQAALQGKEQSFERDIPLPNGGYRSTQAHYIPDNRGGKIHGFFVLVFDVSPLKAAAREQEKLYQIISENYKMAALGEMAGGVAHEINTPLGVIAVNVGIVQNLLDVPQIDREKLKKIFSSIEKTVQRISKIINGLLLFSKDRSGEPFKLTSLHSIFEETLPLCSEKFKKNNIVLSYPESSKVELECRSIEISQVLVNLLNNAFDAVIGLKEKWVAIEVRTDSNYVEISVTDSGPGILPSEREKIMMPFYSTKGVGNGTGLGLSISKGIVEAHGGEFYIDPNATHTKFVIKIPQAQSSHLR